MKQYLSERRICKYSRRMFNGKELYSLHGVTSVFTLRYLIFRSFPGFKKCTKKNYSRFVSIQNFLAISRIFGLKVRFEFNINLLTLVQSYFFCSWTVFSINFNSPFWKCFFSGNAQMLKMWNFRRLAPQMVCKGNK